MTYSNSDHETYVGTPSEGPAEPSTLGANIAVSCAKSYFGRMGLDVAELDKLRTLNPEEVQDRLRDELRSMGVMDANRLDLPSIAGQFTVETLNSLT